jgi:large subunit ribosomal protein L15
MTLIFSTSSWYTRPAKRLWRGNSSGKGSYCGKGIKGQKARAGKWSHVPAHFEWGQTPLHRRLPKLRWFKKFFKHLSDIQAVSLSRIESCVHILTWSTVSKIELKNAGLIKDVQKPVKLISWSVFTKSISFVDIDWVSQWARALVEQSGWSIA